MNRTDMRTDLGIDVMSCVQGNTVRVRSAAEVYRESCIVYDFTREANARMSSGRSNLNRSSSEGDADHRRRRQHRRKMAAKARARRAKSIRMMVLAAFLLCAFCIGGIASRAQSRKVPEAYKYYDTITVGYQENLLDIVEKYDSRDYYDTQFDYVEELCRINHLEYDGTAYPEVAPGTHLVVPYYSVELK